MQKPSPTTYLAYFERYVNLVPEQDLFEAFANQFPILKSFLAAVPSNKQEYAYADSKWTMKEMLLHMIDTERIFSYRALCIARGEQGCLLWFNENSSVEDKNVKIEKVFKHCLKIYPERFFDILYKNADIFKKDSET